jgi:hypothetical protein
MQIAGILRLLFAHHVDHLDASQDRTRTANGLKPEYRPHPCLNGPMILLDAIVQIRTLPNVNGFQVTLLAPLGASVKTGVREFPIRSSSPGCTHGALNSDPHTVCSILGIMPRVSHRNTLGSNYKGVIQHVQKRGVRTRH